MKELQACGRVVAQGVALMTLLVVLFTLGSHHGVRGAADRADGAWHEVEQVLDERAALGVELLIVASAESIEARSLAVDVVEVRLRLRDGLDPKGAAEAHARLGRAIEVLLDIAAANRGLATSHDLDGLRRAFARTEADLASARERHAAAVRRYNDAIWSFPFRLMAAHLDLEPRTAWLAPDSGGKGAASNGDIGSAFVARH